MSYPRILNFKNQPPETPFAPEWDYFIFEDIIKNVNFEKISQIILEKEKEIMLKKPDRAYVSDGGTGLGNNSLTSRYKTFNFFSWQYEEIEKLKEEVYRRYSIFLGEIGANEVNCWVQCWANVMRQGEQIKNHIHTVGPMSYLSGHIVVFSEDSSTYYPNIFLQEKDSCPYDSKNEIGKITIFPSFLPHYTSINNSKKNRITIAFDIITESDYKFCNELDKKNLIPFNFLKNKV